MKVDYRGQDTLTFAGSTLTSTVSLSPGVNEVDNELLRSLLNNAYFNSLVKTEVIILKEALPVLIITEDNQDVTTDPVIGNPTTELEKTLQEVVKKVTKASKALEFSDES